jgi:hypothetical protein
MKLGIHYREMKRMEEGKMGASCAGDFYGKPLDSRQFGRNPPLKTSKLEEIVNFGKIYKSIIYNT